MNGYTRITIGGQEVGLKFSYQANKWFLTALFENTDTFLDGKELTAIAWAKLLHCAYKMNCAIKEQKPKLTTEDFYTWVESAVKDETAKAEFTEAINVWGENEATKDMVVKMNKLNGDKKASKKKQSQTS